jgi:hypothetical protein
VHNIIIHEDLDDINSYDQDWELGLSRFFDAKYSAEDPHCVIFIYGAQMMAWLYTYGGQDKKERRNKKTKHLKITKYLSMLACLLSN